jgi:excisionase family DNA binding protein
MNSTFATTKQLYTEREAAKWLGVCVRTLWAIRASGEIPHVRLGRAIRYDVDDLRAYVARNKKGVVSNG